MASEEIAWVPPATIEEIFAKTGGNKWSSINKPTAGPQTEADLPDTPLALQLYSLATPNGQKVSILLEELGVEYDAHVINIGKGDQFTTGFVSVNPNSKIPALLDKEGPDGKPISVFESVSINLYLAEKFKSSLLPADFRLRTEVLNWLLFQTSGQGPMTGNFGHFFVYAPPDKLEARDYGVGRYGMETQRICSVMERHLEGRTYFVGEEYSLADIVLFPWFQCLRTGYKHASGRTAFEFLNVEQYKNLIAWADRILARPAVVRGLQVCSWSGKAKPWLEEKEASSAL